MRLVDSSDMSSEEVDEYNRRQDLRRRFQEEAILIAALCRELKKEAEVPDVPASQSKTPWGLLPVERSRTAFGLLTAWRENVYGSRADGSDTQEVTVAGYDPPGQVIGTKAERDEVAPELAEEVRLGSAVCYCLEMVYYADSVDYRRDVETLQESLDRYLRHVGWF
jgi:hypothetical protein